MVEAINLPEGLSAYLRPILRIFLSVDIVNSTAFKQSLIHNQSGKLSSKSKEERARDERPEEPWFSPIARFYRGIEQKLAHQWMQCAEQLRPFYAPGDPPSLWKASGDEVIYVKRLENVQQALLTVRAWMAAVNQHRQELKKEFPMLDLKAAAWLAGFPVNNAEVVLRRVPEGINPFEDLAEGDPLLINFLRLSELHDKNKHDDGESFRDYIGPSMDTGFRVAALATPRKLAVTIDLAYLVAFGATSIQHRSRDLPLLKEPTFQYDGRISLKGVSDGAPYPFFWIDMREDNALLKKEDALLGRKSQGCGEVESFCSSFFEDRHDRGPFMTPYICGSDAGTPFDHMPQHHKDRLDGLAYWSQELQKRKEEKQQLSETAKQEPPASDMPAAKSGDEVSNLLLGLLSEIAKRNRRRE